MEQLEKSINKLKLEPTLELVKEAVHRILDRSIRSNPLTNNHLKFMLEILIKFCDTDDSALRSLFNDYLNSVILAFQNQNYNLILRVLVEELANNGSARTLSVALLRIPLLITNVQPIELGCDPQKILKTLIEIARRSDDESVQKALEVTLKHVMPYLDYYVRKSREMQFLTNSLVDVLLRNLQYDSTQIKRVAASSIATICSNSEIQSQNVNSKLKIQLDNLSQTQLASIDFNKYVGFCLCVKELPKFADHHHKAIIKLLIDQIKSNSTNITILISSLEIMKELLSSHKMDSKALCSVSKILADNFLRLSHDGIETVRDDTKVILQTNALACISMIIKQQPQILDSLQIILQYKNHQDVAIRNQVINIIGSYIESTWRFPRCVEISIDCERMRKMWVELRSLLNDETIHPDSLKTCVASIRICLNNLLEYDHCLHIVEYQDFDRLINLYIKSSFKPFRVEILNLFADLNYRTLHYLERHHWSKLRNHVAGSLVESLQDRIMKDVVIASLTDDHQRIRAAAISSLISMVPNLYITNSNNESRVNLQRSADPIVSLASDLVDEHLVVLKQTDEHVSLLSDCDETMVGSEPSDFIGVRGKHSILSSSIMPSYENPNIQSTFCSISPDNTSINLMYVIGILKSNLENSLCLGKAAISSIVKSLHELAKTYPIVQYTASWDCRPSEYCSCFMILNFILAYLENMTEPDVVIEDLEAYNVFLAFAQQLVFSLCHESVLNDYESQRVKPHHLRISQTRDGDWSELTIKRTRIAEVFQIYFKHLVKLLWLISYVIEEKTNPFASSSKTSSNQQQITKNQLVQEPIVNHETLTSNRLFFGRVYKKLELSYRSSKKNLNLHDEKFYQILETCLSNLASLLEYMSSSTSMEYVNDILAYLNTTSTICCISSLTCARQLLKSLFGVNIIAIYQVDPHDWFKEELVSSSSQLHPSVLSSMEHEDSALHGVYHRLIANPYKMFSSYHSMNSSQITPVSDRTLAIFNFESRRALKVRRRIEDRVKSLFEINPYQIMSPKLKQISDTLKCVIAQFSPIVTECMKDFNSTGFCRYQGEILHFMSYLLLLRVNYQKLPLAGSLIASINKLLDNCGERMFIHREDGIEFLLRGSFTFLSLLTYERGPSKPMFQVATVIQKLDDLRAKLSMASATEKDVTTYVVPLLRCLVEDLFIYRTEHFHRTPMIGGDPPPTIQSDDSGNSITELRELKKNQFETLEAERETVAQKLLDVIDNPGIYDLLSILILESRRNSDEIKYKKLSQHLLSIIPSLLSKRSVNMNDYKRIELTRRIIENISPEVFQPIKFIFETLLEAPKPSSIDKEAADINPEQDFQRWMSLVLISIHILTRQVEEEKFLTRIRESTTDLAFVRYLLQVAQLCVAEIFLRLSSPLVCSNDANVAFLTQQLSSYTLYLTHMFQSQLFFQLSKSAVDLIRSEVREEHQLPTTLNQLATWARNPNNDFSLAACEIMFYHIRLIYPDLTIFWCNVMMLLNNVDCNRDYWRNLLVYECHQCSVSQVLNESLKQLAIDPCPDDTIIDGSIIDEINSKQSIRFKRSTHINRPSSLNLSDVNFKDQLRRSFIKKIADSESRDKAFNRNIVETNDEEGRLLEQEVSIGNTEQCLAPNVELSRRAALCLVLDFVYISMSDVEHITWLIIHHINDIVRWSYETPVKEFITAVHGNSASSGIFIQAINSNFNNFSSISFISRLLETLTSVHYTQYGALIVFLVEKLLSSQQLTPYRSLAKRIEKFACETVDKLLHGTNKSLIATNDEIINQLITDDLDRILCMLDFDLYPELTMILRDLRKNSQDITNTPAIEFQTIGNSDEDSDDGHEDADDRELKILYSKANLILTLGELGYTGQISALMPALYTIQKYLEKQSVIDRTNDDIGLVCTLVSSLYTVALNILPPPTRLSMPRFWSGHDCCKNTNFQPAFNFDKQSVCKPINKPVMPLGSKRSKVDLDCTNRPSSYDRTSNKHSNTVKDLRLACAEELFLFDNMNYLQTGPFGCVNDLIIRLARLPLLNSFILTPPNLWRSNIWPTNLPDSDEYKTNFPMVTHDILLKDCAALDDFCDRLLKLGWINRRQFEEAWMTMIGVLSAGLSQSMETTQTFGFATENGKFNLVSSCKVINTLTRYLLLTKKIKPGDPLAQDSTIAHNFDERVYELTKAIRSNLSSLRQKTKGLFEDVMQEKRSTSNSPVISSSSITKSKLSPIRRLNENHYSIGFSPYLKIPAQKLRMSSILNIELNMQDTVVIENDPNILNQDEIDVESCIRLLLSIYKQKFKDPSENILASKREEQQEQPPAPDQNQHQLRLNRDTNRRSPPSQLAPPLTNSMCQSILALSDLFTDYEQFDWLFETFIQMFKLAERNEDEIQMQYLILGLCKATAVRCYEVPNELNTINDINHRGVVFEKCRQSIEKCLKSDFMPLKLNALYGIYYLLEDSINIVASGAWELDDFKLLRQSRLTWILLLKPMMLDKENLKILTAKEQTRAMLKSLCETVLDFELKSLKV